jgi:hypothetical protein
VATQTKMQLLIGIGTAIATVWLLIAFADPRRAP